MKRQKVERLLRLMEEVTREMDVGKEDRDRRWKREWNGWVGSVKLLRDKLEGRRR
jgi:hypothetical protein